jgi:hypothetical protein
VTSREERRALRDLTALLARDLTTVPDEELAAAVRDAEETADTALQWSGRLLRELRRRHPESWAAVSRLTNVPPTTVRRRIEKLDQ